MINKNPPKREILSVLKSKHYIKNDIYPYTMLDFCTFCKRQLLTNLQHHNKLLQYLYIAT